MAVAATGVEPGTDPRDFARQLVESHSGTAGVLSLYLDLDPREFATAPARASHLQSLLNEARRSVPAPFWHDLLDEAGDDLRGVDQHVRDARALAIFISAEPANVQVVRLPHAVRPSVSFSDHPAVGGLVESLTGYRWGVLLVNRRFARLLVGGPEGLADALQFRDDVPNQHDQGGWSQARFQRHVEKEVHDHLVAAAEMVFAQRETFDHLLLAAPSEMHGEFEEVLHPYVQQKLVGWFACDVENTSTEGVLEAARPLMFDQLEAEQLAMFERLRMPSDTGRVCRGWEDVCESLNMQRVERLVLTETASEPVGCCPECGHLTCVASTQTCPIDGTALGWDDDGVELLVGAALRQDADVVTIGRYGPLPGGEPGDADTAPRGLHLELTGWGGVAATLRY